MRIINSSDYTAAMNINPLKLHKLDFEKQKEIIGNATFKDKAELILESDSPASIIETLSPEENYIILTNLEKTYWPDFVKFCNVEQVTFISDFECWQDDQIDQKQLLSWIETLYLSSEEQLFKWVNESDFELIIGSMVDFIEVIKTEDLNMIDDYIGDKPFFTIDNLYYICIDCDNFDTIKKIITMLFENDKKYYIALMESLIAASKDEVVEAAYKFRNSRLHLSGFPEKDEAIKILTPIQNWQEIDKKDNTLLSYANENSCHSLVNVNHHELFLNQAIKTIEDRSLLQDLELELTSLTNKIIVCENMDLKNPVTILEAIKGIKNIVSLGLSDLAKQDILAAKNLLISHWIENIFRWGITLINRTKTQAIQLYNDSGFENYENFARFLGHPYADIVHGIIMFFPKKLKSDASFEIIEYDYFKHNAELVSVSNTIVELSVIISFFAKTFTDKLDSIYDKNYQQLNFNGENINIISLLSSLIINFALQNHISFEPLSNEDISEFIKTHLQVSDDQIIHELKKKLLQLIFSDEKHQDFLILEYIFKLFNEELINIDLTSKIKTNYFDFLLSQK